MSPARSAAVALAAVLTVLGWTGTAAAHVQLQPSVVAPEDPVEFTVLVPSERPARTTKVDLKLPPGVLPFAYGEAPGWKRRLVTADNGAVERVVWTGRLAEDGYARFTFLAGTPERPGALTWKALQTYDDGTVARWIGSPGSESPAPVTRVVAGAPRQNAGGEGAETAASGTAASGSGGSSVPPASSGSGPSSDAPAASGSKGASGTSSASAAGDADDGADRVARGLGIAAVLLALAGLGLAARRRAR